MMEVALGTSGLLYLPMAAFTAEMWVSNRRRRRVRSWTPLISVVTYWLFALGVGAPIVMVGLSTVTGLAMLLVAGWIGPAVSRSTMLLLPTAVMAAPAVGGLVILLLGFAAAAVVAGMRVYATAREDVVTPAVLLAVHDVQTLTVPKVTHRPGSGHLIAPWALAATAVVGLTVAVLPL